MYANSIGIETEKKEYSIRVTLVGLTLVEKSTKIWSSIAIVEIGCDCTSVDGLV